MQWRSIAALVVSAAALTACGGGGGNTPPNTANGDVTPQASTLAAQAAVRHYGDQWAISYADTNTNSTGVGTTEKTYTYTYTVDALLDNGQYALSASTPNIDPSKPPSVTTELHNANGAFVTNSNCGVVTPPSAVVTRVAPPLGDQATEYTCVNSDTITIARTILSLDEIWSSPSGMAVLQNLHVQRFKATATNATQLNPDEPTVVSICLWSPDLNRSVHCESTYSYPAGSSNTLQRRVFDLTSLSFGSSSTPPVAASGTYPAFTPAVPQVGTPTGNALDISIKPTDIKAVYYNDSPYQDRINTFLGQLIKSDAWAALSEYGVGSGHIATPWPMGSNAPSSILDADIQSSLKSQINNNGLQVNDNTYLLVFLPKATTLKPAASGPAACAAGAFAAYHNFITLTDASGNLIRKVPYAVMADCGHGLGAITYAASHEVLEGAVDPILRGYASVQDDVTWSAAFNGSEIGDMCEHLVDNSSISLDGYRTARIWSNSAALALRNPCVPKRSSIQPDIYFNSVPDLSNATTIRIQANNFHGNGKGFVVAPGQSVTIPVRLFSSAPTRGEWHVRAYQTTGIVAGQTGAAAALTFKWANDRQSGQNGDVLGLIVTTPTGELVNGATFVIESSFAGTTSLWVGAVANTAAPTVQ